MSEAHTHHRTMKATISLLTVILLNILIAGCNEEANAEIKTKNTNNERKRVTKEREREAPLSWYTPPHESI